MNQFDIDVGKIDGVYPFSVNHVAAVTEPSDHSVMFLDRNHAHLLDCLSRVSKCLIYVPDDLAIPGDMRERNCFVPVKNPRLAYCMLFHDYGIDTHPQNEPMRRVGDALVSEKARIGDHVVLMPGVKILGEVEIGDNSYVGCNSVLIGRAVIGKNAIIAENVVIGAQSFSYAQAEDGTNVRMPQFGSVIIEDDVSIFANSIVNRGAIEATVIGKNAKISSCSVIGHNVKIGAHSWVIHSHIAGSTVLEENVICSNAQVADQLRVGEHSKIAFGATVLQNVPAGATVIGNPARQVNLRK